MAFLKKHRHSLSYKVSELAMTLLLTTIATTNAHADVAIFDTKKTTIAKPEHTDPVKLVTEPNQFEHSGVNIHATEFNEAQTRDRLRTLIEEAMSTGVVSTDVEDTQSAHQDTKTKHTNLQNCKTDRQFFVDIKPDEDILSLINNAHKRMLGEFDSVQTASLSNMLTLYTSVGMTDELRSLVQGFHDDIHNPDGFILVSEIIDGPYHKGIQPSITPTTIPSPYCGEMMNGLLSLSREEQKILKPGEIGNDKHVPNAQTSRSVLSALTKTPFPIRNDLVARWGLVRAYQEDWDIAIDALTFVENEFPQSDYTTFLSALIAWHEVRPEDVITHLNKLAVSGSGVSAIAAYHFDRLINNHDNDESKLSTVIYDTADSIIRLTHSENYNKLKLISLRQHGQLSSVSVNDLTERYHEISALSAQPKDNIAIRTALMTELLSNALASENIDIQLQAADWILDPDNQNISPKTQSELQPLVTALLSDLTDIEQPEKSEAQNLPELQSNPSTQPKDKNTSVQIADFVEETGRDIEEIERLLNENTLTQNKDQK